MVSCFWVRSTLLIKHAVRIVPSSACEKGDETKQIDTVLGVKTATEEL